MRLYNRKVLATLMNENEHQLVVEENAAHLWQQIIWQLNSSAMGKEKSHTNIVVTSHVDSCKSTAIGHLVREVSRRDLLAPSLCAHSWSDVDDLLLQ